MNLGTRIVIADDHPFLLEGLYNQLVKLGFTNVHKAENGTDALKLIQEKETSLAILDIEMPFMDGLSVASHCKIEGCNTKFIILSYHKEPEFIARAKSMNISGYILKEDALTEIENCIKTLQNNEKYYSKVFNSPELKDAENTADRIQFLSPSELKILKLIAQGLSTKTISEQLFISDRTVEKHRSNIITKLQLKGKTNSLFQWALENKGFF